MKIQTFTSAFGRNLLVLAQRPDWLRRAGIGALVLTAVYGIGAAWSGVRAGNAFGVGFGIVACLLFAGLMALSWRRRTPARGLGKAQDWVQFHVWGGGLFLLAVVYHTGFHAPRSALTGWLLALAVWMTLSGLAGVLLRKWIPRALTSGLEHEVLYERIPELTTALAARTAKLAGEGSAPLAELHRRSLGRLFQRPRWRWIFLVDVTGGSSGAEREPRFLRPLLPAADRERVDELLTLAATKRELDAHFTLQRLLRGWLAFHVPFAFMLMVLIIAHVATVLYF